MPTDSCRRSFAEDPTLLTRIFELLESCFPGIRAQRSNAEKLGLRWEDCSTPFVREKRGQIVSHVGLLEMPYVINGVRRQLGGVHGVCTLEAERRKGHFRRIMEELLEYCDGRFATLELSTEHPEYYEPFGFRVIPEHRFIAEVAASQRGNGFRPFDQTRRGDVELLDRLLSNRAPISDTVGLVEERDVFKFVQAAGSMYYAEELDCLAAYRLEGSKLELFDVVSGKIPSLDALLSQLESDVEIVEFYFRPDRFEVDARAERYRWDRDHFMVRGPFEAENEAFMIPPTARH